MADYRIVSATKLGYEVNRARGVLLVHMEAGQVYTVEELLLLLKDYGLDYTNPEYISIGSALVADGTIETV